MNCILLYLGITGPSGFPGRQGLAGPVGFRGDIGSAGSPGQRGLEG